MIQIQLVALNMKKSVKAFGYDLERYVPVMIVAIDKKAKEAHTSFRMPVDRVIDYK